MNGRRYNDNTGKQKNDFTIPAKFNAKFLRALSLEWTCSAAQDPFMTSITGSLPIRADEPG
ncbi:hypothetical protein TPL01_13830 [Sulfuriferula plumbiphila]|uniref:Uncharacterized protein n=1 Tax=Sulfuriferula plumbiphila TaxID=171865 RepID=A0A512L6Y6_9PROT|nr:hypothetical protein SFPGR_03100 [Sulfuriferula plumbiphila]GEP30245.1 hypothetical protein TPL01_13830 [Sulfuriferula plumbiphila]